MEFHISTCAQSKARELCKCGDVEFHWAFHISTSGKKMLESSGSQGSQSLYTIVYSTIPDYRCAAVIL